MSTNIIYYLLLYVLVLIMRFFKLKNQYKESFRDHWKETFDCAIEIVYTSSGFIIALLMNSTELIPVIIVGYVIIIISASYLERAGKDEFKTNTKFVVNILIIALIASGTMWLMPGNTDINGHKTEITDVVETSVVDSNYYQVLIPYNDESLIKHLGKTKYGNRKMYQSIKIKALDKSEALIQAIQIFEDSLKPEPMFIDKKDQKKVTMESEAIEINEIVIK